jgi:hypothetical protein
MSDYLKITLWLAAALNPDRARMIEDGKLRKPGQPVIYTGPQTGGTKPWTGRFL